MIVKLVSIGNSKGVCIPASFIKKCGLGDELEMLVENGVIVLAPARGVREGWDAAFERMAAASDEPPLLPEDLEGDFDAKDWAW